MSSSKVLHKIYLILLIQNFVHSTWLDDVTKYIVTDSGYYQAYVVTNLPDEEHLESNIVQNFLGNLMSGISTLRINVDKNGKHMFSDTESRHPIDTAPTFFVLVHESSNTIDDAKELIEVARNMTKFHYSPKFLFLSPVSKFSNTLEELLYLAWDYRLLDFTIVEFIEGVTNMRNIQNSPGVQQLNLFKMENKMEEWSLMTTDLRPANTKSLPMVHHLNPFKKEYKKEEWSSTITDLFPNNLNDMYGYPLRIGPNKHLSRSRLEWKGHLDERFYLLLGYELAERMNASLDIFVNDKYYSKSINHKQWNMGFYDMMEKEKIDIWFEIVERFSSHPNDTLRTIAMAIDQMCAVVPRETILNTSVNTDVFAAHGFYVFLISLFWFAKRIFGFDERLWNVWNVSCILFGFSISRHPQRYRDRIMYLGMVLISAIYSSTIYDGITELTIRKDRVKPYESFQDLVEKDSYLLIHPSIIEKSFTNINESLALMSLRDKVVGHRDELTCISVVYYNRDPFACIVRSTLMKLFMKLEHYKNRLLIAKPCFWTDSKAFVVGMGSPYRSTFDKLLLRMQETGIVERMKSMNVQKTFSAAISYYPYIVDEQKPPTHSLLSRNLLIFSVFGYTVSILVFFVEIFPTLYRKCRPLTGMWTSRIQRCIWNKFHRRKKPGRCSIEEDPEAAIDDSASANQMIISEDGPAIISLTTDGWDTASELSECSSSTGHPSYDEENQPINRMIVSVIVHSYND